MSINKMPDLGDIFIFQSKDWYTLHPLAGSLREISDGSIVFVIENVLLGLTPVIRIHTDNNESKCLTPKK